MNDDLVQTQLTRYVFGECTAEEAVALGRWVGEDPGRSAEAEALRKIRDAAPASLAEWDTDANWRRFIAPEAWRAPPQVSRRDRRGERSWVWPTGLRAGRWAWLRPVVSVAAAVALLISGGLLSRSLDHRPLLVGRGMREATTSRGERAMLTLSDGTRVTLGVDTRFRSPYVFDPKVREVSLDGEAYFEVAHDSTRPFIVRTGNTVTRVLGTKFDVRAYRGDAAVQVVVAEGRVALDSAVLTRGMLGRRASNGDIAVRQDVDVDKYLNWTSGRLAFDDTPFDEVARRIEQWYDIDIRIDDAEIVPMRLTGSFENDRLEDVLEVVSLAMDFDYVRTGRVVHFSNRRRERMVP